jgi:hypothetical protein
MLRSSMTNSDFIIGVPMNNGIGRRIYLSKGDLYYKQFRRGQSDGGVTLTRKELIRLKTHSLGKSNFVYNTVILFVRKRK